MASTEERFRRIIVCELGVDEKEIVPEAEFVNDLGADSLGTVELVLAYEHEFEIAIEEEEMKGVTQVGQLLNLVKEKIESRVRRSGFISTLSLAR